MGQAMKGFSRAAASPKAQREGPSFFGAYNSNIKAGSEGFEIENQFQFWIVGEFSLWCQ
jgi:hypothetical protein